MLVRVNHQALFMLTIGCLAILTLIFLSPLGVSNRTIVFALNNQIVNVVQENSAGKLDSPVDRLEVKSLDTNKEEQKNAENEIQYAVVIDVGSSGSRTFIYTWKLSEVRAGELLKIDHLRDNAGRPAVTKIEPAIHEVAKRDEGFFDSIVEPHSKTVHDTLVTAEAKNGESEALPTQHEPRHTKRDPSTYSTRNESKPAMGIVPEKFAYQMDPKYANLTHVEAYIARLIDFTDAYVPRTRRSETSLFVLCTAGIRSLPAITQTRLLNSIRAFIRRAYSDFLFQDEYVEVLTGRQEGIYAWIAANYVLGRFDNVPVRPDATSNSQHQRAASSVETLASENPRSVRSNTTRENDTDHVPVVCHGGVCRYRTLSVIDMGGSSMQLAFEVNDATSSDPTDAAYSYPIEAPAHEDAAKFNRDDDKPYAATGERWRRQARGRGGRLPSEYVADFDLGSSKTDTRYKFTLYVATYDQFGANKANERFRHWLVTQFLRNASFIQPPLIQTTMSRKSKSLDHNRSVVTGHAEDSRKGQRVDKVDEKLRNGTQILSQAVDKNGVQVNYPVEREQVSLAKQAPIALALSDRLTGNHETMQSTKKGESPENAGKRKLLASPETNSADSAAPELVKPQSTVVSDNEETFQVVNSARKNLDLKDVEATVSAVRHPVKTVSLRSTAEAIASDSLHPVNAPLTLTVYDPCSPIGYSDSLRVDESLGSNSLVELRGLGDFDLCLQLLAKANLLNISCAKPEQLDRLAYAGSSDTKTLQLERCTMNGLVQPRLDVASQDFYAFSEFFYTTYDIFGFVDRYNESRFRQAAAAYCATDFSELEKQLVANAFPFGTASRLRAQCFKASWVYAVVHHGLRFPRATDRLVPTRYVRGGEVQWTLGALLYKLRFFPLRNAFDEQMAGQKRVQHAEARIVSSYSGLRGLEIYAQFAFVVCGTLALLALLWYTRCEALRVRFGAKHCSRSSTLPTYRSFNKLHV